MLNPWAEEAQMRRMATRIIVGLGVVTWLICLPRISDLLSVLFFAGPLVGSAIWPVIAGIYWRRANPAGAVAAMVLGSTIGLIAYFKTGWYTASLVGATVSMVVVGLTTLLWPREFDWKKLNEAEAAS
jgi:Na+/pantothenate symporter